MEVSRFRDIASSGELSAVRCRDLSILLGEIVELLGILGQCCGKADKDVIIKGGKIAQN
jgi:hypothetical protein